MFAEVHRHLLRVPVHAFLVPAPKLQAVVRRPAIEPVAKARAILRLEVFVAIGVLHLVHSQVGSDGQVHAPGDHQAVEGAHALHEEEEESPWRDAEDPSEARHHPGGCRLAGCLIHHPGARRRVHGRDVQPAEPQKYALADEHVRESEREVPLVSNPDARPRDGAVVVHAVHAPVAVRAVLAAQRSRAVTRLAESTAGDERVDARAHRHRVGECLGRVVRRDALLLSPRRALRLGFALQGAGDAPQGTRPLVPVPRVRGGRNEPGTEVIRAKQRHRGGDEREGADDAPERSRRPLRGDVHDPKL